MNPDLEILPLIVGAVALFGSFVLFVLVLVTSRRIMQQCCDRPGESFEINSTEDATNYQKRLEEAVRSVYDQEFHNN